MVKELWDRGLVYKGFKVMPVSTALETVLANFGRSGILNPLTTGRGSQEQYG